MKGSSLMSAYFILVVILVTLFILPLTKVSAQSSAMWDKTYGGTEWDRAKSLVVTSDGGYAIVGRTNSFGEGGGDAWLVKTDALGNMMWNHSYGGTNFDAAISLVVTSDGGYAVAGFTSSFGAGDADFWLVKTDSYGNMVWQEAYGGTGLDRAYAVVVAPDGGYALAGYTNSFDSEGYDFWLVKTDSSGNMEWSQTYGGTEYEYAFSMVATSDGGYAMAGETGSFGAEGDFWLVKTDASGNMLWSQNYGVGTKYDRAYSLAVTSDGSYVMAGSTAISDENVDFALVKTDSSGNMVWQKTYGKTAGDYGVSDDTPNSVVQTDDGGYALAGYIGPSATGADAWLVKTDANGDMEWNQTYGESGDDLAYCVVQTSDGGYVLAAEKSTVGDEDFDFWLVKTDEFGVIPEFPSWTILPLGLLVLVIASVYRKKLRGCWFSHTWDFVVTEVISKKD